MDASPPSPESSSRARPSPTAEPAAISRGRIEVALLWLEGLLGPPLHLLQAIYFAWGWIIAALAARLLTSSR